MWRWVALATGCAGEGSVGGEEARTWEGDFLLDEIVIDCDAGGWTYDVRTQGWGQVITVDVVAREFGALVWSEHHELPEVEYGEGWARHRLELAQVYEGTEYVSSETTWLACDAKTFLTYGFAAWRYDDEMQECAAWGVDPEGEFPDCVNWGEVGH